MSRSTSPNSRSTTLVMFPFGCFSFRGSWTHSPSVASTASTGSNHGRSSSYSTSMSSRARIAVSSSTAATAATPSPTKRTLSTARGYSSGVQGMIPYFTGMSRPVMTAWTPSRASAFEVSTETIRAWGWGLRRIFPWSMPGRAMSSV